MTATTIATEQETMKKSGFSRSELAMVRERAEATLRGADAPGDASKLEKDAVSARAGDLEPLLGRITALGRCA